MTGKCLPLGLWKGTVKQSNKEGFHFEEWCDNWGWFPTFSDEQTGCNYVCCLAANQSHFTLSSPRRPQWLSLNLTSNVCGWTAALRYFPLPKLDEILKYSSQCFGQYWKKGSKVLSKGLKDKIGKYLVWTNKKNLQYITSISRIIYQYCKSIRLKSFDINSGYDM